MSSVATRTGKTTTQRSNTKKPSAKRPTVRSQAVREQAHKLATLAARRFGRGEPLNVRRREKVRRVLAEAGESLQWEILVALTDDPLEMAADDVRRMLRSGVRSLDKDLEDEIAERRAEKKRLGEVVKKVHKLAEKPDLLPAEIVYERTVEKKGVGFVTKEETLDLQSVEEALKAAEKMERSLPRWEDTTKAAVEDLKRRREMLAEMGRNLSDVVEGWRGLLRDVVATMA